MTWAEASSCYASGDFPGGKHRTILDMLKYRQKAVEAEGKEAEEKQKQNE